MGVRVRWNWDRWKRRGGDTRSLAWPGGGSRRRGCWGRLQSDCCSPPEKRRSDDTPSTILHHLQNPHQQKQSPRFNFSLPTSTTPKPHITNPIFLPTQTPINSHNTKTPQITNLKTLPPKLPLIQTNYWVILKLIEHRFRFTNKGKSPRKRNKTIQRMRDE